MAMIDINITEKTAYFIDVFFFFFFQFSISLFKQNHNTLKEIEIHCNLVFAAI